MTGDGHIKIADFGVAVEDMFGGRKIKGRTGTLKYMAPEVLDMKAYDVGADWWSLGIVICKMASKTAPFSDGSHGDNYTSSVIQDEPIFPEGLSSDLEDLLRKLLEKDPEKRLGFMENVRKHPVFNSIDWEQLERLKVPPPIQPEELTTKDFRIHFKKPWVPLEPQETKNYSSDKVTLTDFSYLSDTWGS
ncbi:protein kinase C delta type-like [Xenopus laevis]|uniref:Protein kinase C delta type-like n=1 Tax=Xenopus laevis TaxID=8355 RepID=A0A8J1MCB5_XENLA|nr:protein kinase C delta type-like [Xenopus laevis]